ncbi:MAG TPA: hypothetical protein VIJ82_10225 [Streptosporangiaceae bacterium]
MTPADQLADLPIREHARRLIAECIRLSKLPGFGGLRLAAWARMLGFSGHFSTKPYLLRHSQRAPRRPRQTSTRVRHGRWTLARPRWRHGPRSLPLELHRTRTATCQPASSDSERLRPS